MRIVFYGIVAGFLAYGILFFMHNPWEEALAALMIGSIPGIVAKKERVILAGSLSCLLGWLMGTMVFGILLEVGLGAWIIAGAGFGLTSGLLRRSYVRSILGFMLGFIAGLVAEASRYLTVLFRSLRAFDMQLILLVAVGILFPIAAFIVYGLGRREQL